MLLTDTGGGDFENPEPGSYGATCRQVIDLGTQESNFEGKINYKHQILIGWELDELMKDGRPFVQSKFYTASLNEKANLRHDLDSWRGRSFTDDELGGFSPKNLLGAPCMLSLITNDKGKIKISGIMKLPKGMTVPALVNPKLYFSLSPTEFDMNVFNELSDGIKKIIVQSPEYQSRIKELQQEPKSNDSAIQTHVDFDDFVDDIPF